MALPSPYNNAGLIMQGFGQAAEGVQQGVQQAQQNAPGDPLFDKWLDRMMAGEDPAELGRQFRQSPEFSLLMNKIQNQGNPQNPAAASTPDAGMQGGMPAVMPPGAVNPAGGPQGLTGFGFGAMRPPAGGGLTEPQQLPPTPSGPSNIGRMDAVTPQGPWQGADGQSALLVNAQPLPGPHNSPAGGTSNEVLAGARPKPQPQAQPQQAPQGAPQPGQAPGRTVAQQQRLMPLAQTLAAAQSRQEVARMQTDQKRDAVNAQLEARSLIALMKENGLDRRQIEDILMTAQGLDSKVQIAVLQALAARERALIAAGAAVKVAGMKGDTGNDQTIIKTLTQQITATEAAIAKYSGAQKVLMPDGTYQTREQAQARLKQLKAEYDSRIKMGTPAPQGAPGSDASYGGLIAPGMTTPPAGENE